MKLNKKSFLAVTIFSLLIVSANTQAAELAATYTLDSLLTATTQNHPELLKLEEEYRRSILDVKDAWGSLGPTVDLQASGTYMVKPPLGAIYINSDDIINAIQWNGARPRNSGQRIKIYDGMESTLYNFQLDVTQPIFTWGKITNAIKLYSQVSKIKLTQITQQKAQLVFDVAYRHGYRGKAVFERDAFIFQQYFLP